MQITFDTLDPACEQWSKRRKYYGLRKRRDQRGDGIQVISHSNMTRVKNEYAR